MTDLRQKSMILQTHPCKSIDGTQGAKANMTGQTAEDVIYCILKERGYEVRRQVKIGTSIYGSDLTCDFVVNGLPAFEDGLIIESKWQSVSGSVDEKFPYLVQNIRQRFPFPAFVVLGGGGAKAGAIKWLKEQIDGQSLVAVFSFEQFLLWVMEDL